MPNIWTHILFCEEVVDAIEQPYPYSRNEPYMKLGAQGPDPFFYYNFWPWIKNEPINEIGSALHTKNCGAFLLDLITRAKDANDEVKAYVTGFITHHILDRNTHPYIHYRAGYEGSNHQKLEITIDTLMMERYHKLKTWKYPVYKEIYVGKRIDPVLHDFLDNAIKENYQELKIPLDDYIQKSYSDMILAFKLLADPYGWKNILFKPLISSYSHKPVRNRTDYLNLDHKEWHHPATNEPRTESFIDLYNEARVEGIVVLSELRKYWEGCTDYSSSRLSELIDDISYDTGMPLHMRLENRYSDPII